MHSALSCTNTTPTRIWDIKFHTKHGSSEVATYTAQPTDALCLEANSTHPLSAINIVGLRDNIVAIGTRQKYRHSGKIVGGGKSAVGNTLTDKPFLLPNWTILVFSK